MKQLILLTSSIQTQSLIFFMWIKRHTLEQGARPTLQSLWPSQYPSYYISLSSGNHIMSQPQEHRRNIPYLLVSTIFNGAIYIYESGSPIHFILKCVVIFGWWWLYLCFLGLWVCVENVVRFEIWGLWLSVEIWLDLGFFGLVGVRRKCD